MRAVILSLMVAIEFIYYLLIAQTGIVEYFNSDMSIIFWLPLGGVVGTFAVILLKGSYKNKLFLAIFLQTLITLSYPHLSSLELFLLGLSVGASAPLIIRMLQGYSVWVIVPALMISYVSGTMLFTSDVANRGILGLFLSVSFLIMLYFVDTKEEKRAISLSYLTIFTMSIWVFLDSALFETLSRDAVLSIWRDGYSIEIALFHTVGVVFAYFFHKSFKHSNRLITLLFAISYLSYFAKNGILLSAVYPFVISYYNVVILTTLIKERAFGKIVFAMALIGWGASGAGLIVALNALLALVGIVLALSAVFVLIYSLIELRIWQRWSIKAL